MREKVEHVWLTCRCSNLHGLLDCNPAEVWQSPCTGGAGRTRGAVHVLSPLQKEKYVVFLSNCRPTGFTEVVGVFCFHCLGRFVKVSGTQSKCQQPGNTCTFQFLIIDVSKNMAAKPSANDNHNKEFARPIRIVAGKPIVVLIGDNWWKLLASSLEPGRVLLEGSLCFQMERWIVITFRLISSSPLTLHGHHGNVCGPSCLDKNGFVLH